MRILIINIKGLLQVREAGIEKICGTEMSHLPVIENAFLLIENTLITDFGIMCQTLPTADQIIDATGKFVLPAWCDSHSHLVFAGNRHQEFVDKINGLSYEEIAARGGGILNSAKVLGQTSEDLLFEQSSARLQEVIKLGTGAIEIKSGYGLHVEGELKMLRVINKLKQNFPISIRRTFLGAHAIPQVYKENREGYLDLIVHEMLPAIAQENLADYMDVFCERGYFSAPETDALIQAGKKYGLEAKIHVNQFHSIGGVQVCVAQKAISADHLEVVTPEDLISLKSSKVMPVALPGCSFFLGIPYTPVRTLLEQGLPVALASDFNPGSSPSGNMNFVVSLACIKMKMTPEEAINAATINGAYAMGLSKSHGSITRGKKANLIITRKMDSYIDIPYSFGSNPVAQVIINGKLQSV